jgi:membrane associated rhomboid family serine protease
MIPLRDNIPHTRTPYINYAIIVVNSLVFLLELGSGSSLPELVEALGFVPGRFVALLGYLPESLPVLLIPLFTSLFLHGGWLHIIGNMWFLYIFGDNVEDTLGHWRYLVFYLICGVGANLIFMAFSPKSAVPLIGASGAIAGVMGAYFFLFPGARILALVPIFIIFTLMELPAYLFLGLWFLLQFFLGTYSTMQPGPAGGVAFWAHVGGFVVGILLLYLFAPGQVRISFPHWKKSS